MRQTNHISEVVQRWRINNGGAEQDAGEKEIRFRRTLDVIRVGSGGEASMHRMICEQTMEHAERS
jgi:hypothetical protein